MQPLGYRMPAWLLEMQGDFCANFIGDVNIRVSVNFINGKAQVFLGTCQQHFFVCFHILKNFKLFTMFMGCPLPTTSANADCLPGDHILHAFSLE